jgi:hypothetical protein
MKLKWGLNKLILGANEIMKECQNLITNFETNTKNVITVKLRGL